MENEKFYMDCKKCGYSFLGEPGDKCPECESTNTEPSQREDDEDGED